MIEFKQNMGKRIYIQRKRMSYGEYGFTKRSEVQSSYQEYSCKPREEKEQSYQEYGDPKMAGLDSIFSNCGAPAHVDMKAFDDKFENFLAKQEEIKAERLAKRTAYCDEHDIQGDIREKILKGRISIEEFEALQKSATEVTEAPEQPAEEPVEVQTDVNTAETETVPEQPQTGKKKKSKENSKKNTEEVSDAE